MSVQHSPLLSTTQETMVAVDDGNPRPAAANLKLSTNQEQEDKTARSMDPRHKQKTANRFQSQDSRKSGDPPGFREVQEMLVKEGVEKWDKNVVYQLHEFMQQITGDLLDQANFAAEHRDSQTIDRGDVEEALNTFRQNLNLNRNFQTPQMQTSIAKINAEPLPKIRCDYGIHAPNERFMTIQPDYVRPQISTTSTDGPPAAKRAFALNRSTQSTSMTEPQTLNQNPEVSVEITTRYNLQFAAASFDANEQPNISTVETYDEDQIMSSLNRPPTDSYD